jgi:hypothetical protein
MASRPPAWRPIRVADRHQLTQKLSPCRRRHPHEVAHQAFTVIHALVLKEHPQTTERALVKCAERVCVLRLERISHRLMTIVHGTKIAFEKYFLWKMRNGYVKLP